ncbi:alpha/beta hydrolase-fold protein [Pseudalkalibacillus hwajinpoensis]|uniref:alpha/beta hydrolase n=1 Tax=Guptibacillus hwajinpoensis TaxID=208199 RepID=UPI00325BCA5E
MLFKTSYFIPAFNEERMIRIYLPDTYDQTSAIYPVLYMHDGQNVFDDEGAVGGRSLRLKDYLDRNKVQLIVVAIDSGANRMVEYRLWPPGELSEKLTGRSESLDAKGREYIDFIAKDLKEYIDDTYRTRKESNYMAGISLGGLITTYALCRYPSVFSRGAGISSGFFRNQEELEKFIGLSNLSTIDRLYLDCGTSESSDGRINQAFYDSNERIYRLLKEKLDCIEFNVVENGEHKYESFSDRVEKVMTFLMDEN